VHVVGVPVTAPVDGLIARPGGRSLAVQVYAGVPPSAVMVTPVRDFLRAAVIGALRFAVNGPGGGVIPGGGNKKEKPKSTGNKDEGGKPKKDKDPNR